jgi:hypothetical protein
MQNRQDRQSPPSPAPSSPQERSWQKKKKKSVTRRHSRHTGQYLVVEATLRDFAGQAGSLSNGDGWRGL